MAAYLSSVMMILSSKITANVFGHCNNSRSKVISHWNKLCLLWTRIRSNLKHWCLTSI